MERKIEELCVSMNLMHQRLDRLFYWTGFMQQGSKVNQALNQSLLDEQNYSQDSIISIEEGLPETESRLEQDLLARLTNLKLKAPPDGPQLASHTPV